MLKILSYVAIFGAVTFAHCPAYAQEAVVDETKAASQISFSSLIDTNSPNFFIEPFSNKFSNNVVTNFSNITFGYKKGDWKKPTKWKKSYAKKAKYGDGVTIGIMDTKINCAHKNLKTTSKRTCESFHLSSGSFANKKFGHGSNAAGVAAGTGGYGVASKANIVGAAVFDDDGWYVSNAEFKSAVDFLVNKKDAKVINWSFGVPYIPGQTFKGLTSSDIAASRIAKGKALITKAAGNGYKGKGKYFQTSYTTSVSKNVLKKYINNVIFVGALNKKGTKIASFSDRPGEACLQGLSEFKCTKKNKYKYYFIVAPGYVKSTAGSGNGSTKTQGTSFSAPIVAGAAALIQSRWPKLKPHQVRDILLKTATDKGKKGVDKVYGRGVLNISKALKPVKGKVGGVKVNSKNAIVFNRVASLGKFSSDIKVIDAFGRDFDAVGYALGNEAVINTVDILPDGEFAIHLNQGAMSQNDVSFDVIGVSVGGLSYFSEMLGNVEDTRVELDNAYHDVLPSVLLELNVGNQAAIYKNDDFAVFALAPNKNNDLVLDTSTIGVTKSWATEDNWTFSSTAALMTEKGFHGLSSVDDFGFENKNQSVFIQVGLSHSDQFGSFDIGFNHHKSTADYSSEHISWDSLAVSQIEAGFSKVYGDMQLDVKAISDLNVTGTLKSAIKNLETAKAFYHRQSKIAINLNKHISDQSKLNFELTTQGQGAFSVSYGINF